MKKYYKLMPLLLLIFMVASTYKLASDKISKQTTYYGYLEQAESFYNDGIVVDAVSTLELANQMNPSIDILLKEGEYYQSIGYSGDAMMISEKLLETYPKDPKAYDFALLCFLKFDSFQDCYDVLDTAQKRNISSETIKKVTEDLKYKYYLTGKSYEEIGAYNAGYYAVKRKGNWGYCNEKGTSKLDYIYSYAGPFVNSLAPITDVDGNTYFIDENGYKKLNIPAELNCEKAGALISGTVVLVCNGKYGYYDEKFEHKFGNYDYASTMYNSTAVIKEGDSWYLIDKTGKKINSSPYNDVKVNKMDIANISGLIFVKTNDKYILVNTKGKQIGNSQFDDAACFNGEGFAAVKIGEKWGFVDEKGNVVVEPSYEDARSFSNGLAAVKINGKWGYIDERNNIVIDCIFLECLDFNAYGHAFVRESNENYSVISLYSKNH